MIWRNYSNKVLIVLINNANLLSKKATDGLLGFPNVASQDVFDNILVL